MMLKRNYYFVFLCFFLTAFCSCVQVRLRTANENYALAAYAPAAADYEYVLSHRADHEAIINVADCYRQMGSAVKTEFWYRRAVKLPEAKPEWNFYLAEAMMRNGKYDDALQALHAYLELNRDDYRAQRMIAACEDPEQFRKDTTLYSIAPLRFNTPGENYFSPAFYRSGIVFLSDRYTKGLNKAKSDLTGSRYLDLFYAKKTDHGNWLDPEPLRGDVNGKFNEGPVVFTADDNTLYFTRNNYTSNVVEKNSRDINVLKIYKAEAKDGLWEVRGEMNFNSGDYSVGHPATNHDGTQIYFISDMPWGYGGTDIYKVTSTGGSNWSEPVNIGNIVNSEGNEMFPYLMNDSTLYFASDGLGGMGGLDIYETRLVNGQWTSPLNLGVPVNSPSDDFGYIVDSTGTDGYFTSRRDGIEDRIFSFVKNPPKLQVEIRIFDEKTKSPIAKASVKVSQDGKRDTTVITNNTGIIRFKAEPDKNYQVTSDNADYYFAGTNTSTKGKRFSELITVDVPMKAVPLNKPFIWKGIDFKKKDWQMKLTSGDALESLVNLLKSNPRLNFEIAAYTDSRGSDQDNLLLTQRRAELVMQYLSSHAVKPERMTAKGYGESKLLNKCTNGLLCIEEEHEINNRIEINITSISKDTAFK